MHDAVAGDPMWLVTEHGDNASIDVIKMTGVLTNAAAFTYTNLAVTPYSAVASPLNPNGTVITNNIDSRIHEGAEANNTIVASPRRLGRPRRRTWPSGTRSTSAPARRRWPSRAGSAPGPTPTSPTPASTSTRRARSA